MQCVCIPQQRVFSKPYQVIFQIDQNRKVTKFWCSCVAGGGGQCKHSCSFYIWINQENTRTKTDYKNSWQEPSERAKELYRKAKTALELFGGRGVNNDFQPTAEKIAFQKNLMEKCGLQVCISFLKSYNYRISSDNFCP